MVVVFKHILGEIPVHPDSQPNLKERFCSYLDSGSPHGCEATIMGYGHIKDDVTAFLNFNSIACIIDTGGKLTKQKSLGE